MGSYPADAKKLAHSVGVMPARMRRMAWRTPLTVRSAAFRRSAFSLEKALVDHDEVAWRQRRHEHLCHVRQEALAVDGAVEQLGGGHAAQRSPATSVVFFRCRAGS